MIIGLACGCKNVENIGRYEFLLSGTDEARIPFRNSGAWDPLSDNRDLCGTGATVGTFRMKFLRIGRDMLQVEQLRVQRLVSNVDYIIYKTFLLEHHYMSSSCQALLSSLKDCLLHSDCVLKQGRLPSECLKKHINELPEQCQALRKAMFECKRNMVCICVLQYAV